MRTLLKHFPRVWQIVVVLTWYVFAPRVPFRRRTAPSQPVRLRMALERLGGAWIKLGQMLALRFDLLPAAYCNELFSLLNKVTPFPYAQVVDIVRQELGAAPEVVFRSFAPEPFAAASIGQVHMAILHTGQRVAVKVQRPTIRHDLQSDIELMYAVSRILDWTHLFGATHSRQIIDEFARWTADELDYMVEARQAALLYEHARGERLEKIARVYRHYTTSRVLTSDFIEGIPLIEIMYAVREGNTVYLRNLAAKGYDLDRIVHHLDWNMLNQVYVFGCFHADLHPANLFVLPGNAIGYVDFGVIGQLPDDVRSSLTLYSWRLFQQNVAGAVKELMRWLAPTSATDAAAASQHLIRVHYAFLYNMGDMSADGTPSSNGRNGRDADNPYSKLAVDIMETIRQHKMTLSPNVVSYLKMLVTLGTIRHELASNYNLPLHARRFFRRLLLRQGTSWLDPRQTLSRAYAGSLQVQRALQLVGFVEDQVPVIVEVENSLFRLQHLTGVVRRRVIWLALFSFVVLGVLYVVLNDPKDTRAVVPHQIPLAWVHAALLVILAGVILAIALHFMRLREAVQRAPARPARTDAVHDGGAKMRPGS